MKKVQFFGKSILACAALVLAAACSGDSASGTGGHSGSYITAKVDGSSYDAAVMGVPVVTALRTGSGPNDLISVTGTDASGNTVVISLFGVNATGDYTTNPDSEHLLAYVKAENGMSTESFDTGECSGATGVIHVTSLSSTQVEGTFEFTGKCEESSCSSKTITEGNFRGIFQQ